MKKYNKILVALDGSKVDKTLINFVNKIAPYLGTKLVVGFHAIPVINIGQVVKVDSRLPLKIVTPAVELIRLAFETEMKTLNNNIAWELELKEGRPYKELIEVVDEIKPDLLIMGHKKMTSGSGITTKLVARNIDTDVLIIPKNLNCSEIEIVAPIDFSENAYRSLIVGLEITNEMNLERALDVLTVVEMPEPSLYKNQEKYEQIQEEVMKYVMEDYEEFIDYYQLNPTAFNIVFRATTEKVSTQIMNFATDQNKNLILVGAKGHGFLERFVFGSTTENLLERLEDQALWIVR